MSQPATIPEEAVSLANGIAFIGHTEGALQWMDVLSETVARAVLVPQVLTDIAIHAKARTRLQKLPRNGAWGARADGGG